MKRGVIPFVVFAGMTGSARAEVCSVAIPRAPVEVRTEIETWVRAEPRCSVELEVRVVPTEGGFYLFARDRQGRVRERVVPDAQSAGVLVASWVADDSVVQEIVAGGDTLIDLPPPSDVVVGPVTGRFEIAPPGTVAPSIVRAPSTRWFSAGGIVQVGDPGALGLRAEVDVTRLGGWMIGAEMFGAGTSQWLSAASDIGYVQLRDVQVLATLSHTTMFGRWFGRVGFGVGVTHTSANGQLGADSITAAGWFPGGELSLQVGRELGASWAVTFGPTVTAYSQTLDATRAGMSTSIERHETQLLAFGGLRHRL